MNESEMEAQLFAQSASIDKLLNMMRSLDPTSQNLAQNEELLVSTFSFERERWRLMGFFLGGDRICISNLWR